MSSVPTDYRNDAVETWLLTYAYFHRRDYLISETELNESIPLELLQTLPSRQHLLRVAWNLVNAQLLNPHSNYDFKLTITDEGIFQFRKHLQPFIEKARTEGNLNTIIDSGEGNKEVKKQIKKFFKENARLSTDDINEKLKDLMWSLGKEGITILVKMMLSGVPQ